MNSEEHNWPIEPTFLSIRDGVNKNEINYPQLGEASLASPG